MCGKVSMGEGMTRVKKEDTCWLDSRLAVELIQDNPVILCGSPPF